ncbi:hypothetical protein JTE90_027756 [Oedothorax gibbosus]|uniref:Uncharacterized protein n=1 Tax=Oedothorax gibbosus TaxID=931172 RepID=A0AAV6V6B0_9ARAC|nr:hypothetical protein JTE90_027756 [Oedothorax gibbosus]
MECTLLSAAVAMFIICITKTEALACESRFGPKGKIEYSLSTNKANKCFNIIVPSDSFIRINLTKLSIGYRQCGYNFLKISVDDSDVEYKYCDSITSRTTIMAVNNVTVTLSNTYNSGYRFVLNFEYEIWDFECSRKNSFRCTNYSCIPENQVCDGIKQCQNGADEVGCETGVLAIRGVSEARDHAVSWMLGQRTPSWGWGENTHRAVTALFLASAVNFNGTDKEEELMAKQAELRTAVALYGSSLTNNELSMLVNALLVTCHNPRHFFGKNLVKQLKEQVESTTNFTHPIAYLALCNANETWPRKAYNDLNSVLDSDSDYPFVTDIQAMAVLALSCNANSTINLSNTSTLYKAAIKRFKNQQLQDGSFGNVHTTALITQALIASGQEESKDWKLNKTIEYIIKELNSTSVNFLSMYLTLPILNGKTLVNISTIDCTANPRKNGDDIISEINDYLGSKIRVKYYLYIGDKKDVIHSISLRVPENFTAFDIMQLAEAEDPKYKFEQKRISGKIYIYKLANITNDPEGGKFWLQYSYLENNGTRELTHFTESLDNATMKDGQDFIMWYKTANI